MAEESKKNSILKGRKVMWIEDDRFLSDLITRRLTDEGVKILSAEDGQSALPKVEREMPDVILLDILLPTLSGFEVLERLKKNPKTKGIPVIILSNLGQKTDIDRGVALGAARFLIKATVTLDEIIEEIELVLGKEKSGD